MLEVAHIKAFNIEGAIRGMRNPYKNTEKSDSLFDIVPEGWASDIINDWVYNTYNPNADSWSDKKQEEYLDLTYEMGYNYLSDEVVELNLIGPKDLALAQKLIKAGSPHNKFMRQIFVSMDINAPLYWWKEMDQYKIGTVTDSESTMHTITKKEFTLDMFSSNDSFYNDANLRAQGMTVLMQDVFLLNTLRKYYLAAETPEQKKQLWRALIQKLPSSYNQTRTWTGNYEILRNIVHQRNNHVLSEWAQLIEAFHELPYDKEIIFYEG